MNKISGFAAILLGAAISSFAATQAPSSADPQGDPQRPPRSGSLTQDFKNDAKQAGTEIKEGAQSAGKSVSNGTKKAQRKVAIAQCNDGRYSYTRKNTCSDHGGVKTQLH